MTKLIGFGIISITIVYPLLSPFSHLFRNLVDNLFTYTKKKGLVKGGLMFITEALLGCVYLIYKYFSAKAHAKKKSGNSIKMDYDFTFLEQEESKIKYPKTIYLFSFLLSLIDLLTFIFLK